MAVTWGNPHHGEITVDGDSPTGYSVSGYPCSPPQQHPLDDPPRFFALQVPGLEPVDRTAEEAAADAQHGHTWAHYALHYPGWLYGRHLLPDDAWIYADAQRRRWLVSYDHVAGGMRLHQFGEYAASHTPPIVSEVLPHTRTGTPYLAFRSDGGAYIESREGDGLYEIAVMAAGDPPAFVLTETLIADYAGAQKSSATWAGVFPRHIRIDAHTWAGEQWVFDVVVSDVALVEEGGRYDRYEAILTFSPRAVTAPLFDAFGQPFLNPNKSLARSRARTEFLGAWYDSDDVPRAIAVQVDQSYSYDSTITLASPRDWVRYQYTWDNVAELYTGIRPVDGETDPLWRIDYLRSDSCEMSVPAAGDIQYDMSGSASAYQILRLNVSDEVFSGRTPPDHPFGDSAGGLPVGGGLLSMTVSGPAGTVSYDHSGPADPPPSIAWGFTCDLSAAHWTPGTVEVTQWSFGVRDKYSRGDTVHTLSLIDGSTTPYVRYSSHAGSDGAGGLASAVISPGWAVQHPVDKSWHTGVLGIL